MSSDVLTAWDDSEGFNPLSPEQRAIVVSWCKAAFRPAKTLWRDHTSYGIKHIFEDDTNGFYTTDGQFRQAMKEAGFEAKIPRYYQSPMYKVRPVTPLKRHLDRGLTGRFTLTLGA